MVSLVPEGIVSNETSVVYTREDGYIANTLRVMWGIKGLTFSIVACESETVKQNKEILVQWIRYNMLFLLFLNNIFLTSMHVKVQSNFRITV